jgi:hypothetical protein
MADEHLSRLGTVGLNDPVILFDNQSSADLQFVVVVDRKKNTATVRVFDKREVTRVPTAKE